MKKINWLTTIALCAVLLNFAAGCSNGGLSGSGQADSSAGHSENTSAAATTILPSPSTENAYGGGTGNSAGPDNSASAENVPAEFNIPSITIAVGERHAFSVHTPFTFRIFTPSYPRRITVIHRGNVENSVESVENSAAFLR